MKELFTPKANGFIVPNLFAFLVLAVTRYLGDSTGELTVGEFIVVPLCMGIISAWYWRERNLPSRTWLLNDIANCFIAIALSAIFFGEGVICLIIVSPLLFTFIWAGAHLGKAMFNKDDTTLNVSIFAAILLIFITDTLSEHHYQNMVSDELIINATPDKIWKNVVAFERIKQENKYWLFKVGMPSPVESTVTGYHLGAGRKCIFSNGYVFDEKIVTYDENKNLTFDVTHQPRDPEIMGHIDILRGQFILKDNGNGTTTLIGNSWYKLYVFPTWYYDIWAKSITRNVHWRVMEHIKELSEAK